MSLFAAYLDLAGKPVLLVGGGSVALRKLRALQEAEAEVTVVAPVPAEELAAYCREHGIRLQQRAYRDGDVSGNWLVVTATDAPEVNTSVAREAEAARVFCNVVDDPELCSFHVPAVVRRGLLQLAISTGGSSPAFAGRLRRRLEREFGPVYSELMEAMLELRRHVQAKYPDEPEKRRRLLTSFLDSDAPALLLEEGDRGAFRRRVEEWKSR